MKEGGIKGRWRDLTRHAHEAVTVHDEWREVYNMVNKFHDLSEKV